MDKEENLSLAFVKHWVKAFVKILKLIGDKPSADNVDMVDEVLKDEELADLTPEQRKMLEEKRRLMIQNCEDVDDYHRLKAEAEKSDDLETWFKGKVSEFTHDTIPDANDEDVKEVETMVEGTFDDDIQAKASLLEDEFDNDKSTSSDQDQKL